MAEYYARKAELAQKVESQKPAETAEQESQTTLSDQKETETAVNQSEEEASSQIAESVESEEEKYNRSLKKPALALVRDLMLSWLIFVMLMKNSLKTWKRCSFFLMSVFRLRQP